MNRRKSTGGPPLGDNDKFRYLLEHGPTPLADIATGGLTLTTKQNYDIRRFRLSPTPSNTNRAVPAGVTVAYLGQRHDPRDVLRVWVAESRTQLEHHETDVAAVTYGLSGEFKDAWRDINEEFEWLPRGNRGQGGDNMTATPCPACSEPVENTGRHLRHHCPKTADGGDA